MSGLTPEQLEEMREDGLSPDRKKAFALAERATDSWERKRGRARSQLGIEDILAWIDELRAVFGDPEVDRRPWVGNDFRI